MNQTIKAEMTQQELRELDAWIAENVMGWRRVQAPKHDYDGPLPEQGLVLVPPSFIEKDYQWQPRGVIPFNAFLGNFRPATSPADAMEVLKKCVARVNKNTTHFLIIDQDKSGRWFVYIYDAVAKKSNTIAEAKTLELAICLFSRQLFGKEAGRARHSWTRCAVHQLSITALRAAGKGVENPPSKWGSNPANPKKRVSQKNSEGGAQ